MVKQFIQKWQPLTATGLIGGLALTLVILAVIFSFNSSTSKTHIRLGSGIYDASVARSDVARQKGLGGVESLAPNEALLMVFPSDNMWGIWMKDMKIPIDIVWADKDKKIIHLVAYADPALQTSTTFRPSAPARYVIELPAGAIKRSAIVIGATAVFSLKGGS